MNEGIENEGGRDRKQDVGSSIKHNRPFFWQDITHLGRE